MIFASCWQDLLFPQKKKVVKTKFTPEEDERIRQLVQQHGTENWALIASHMKGRKTRQVRERYQYFLAPELKSDHWTEEEDSMLMAMVGKLGKHWKHISERFPGRTDINVKNRYNKLMRRNNKKERAESKKFRLAESDVAKASASKNEDAYAGEFWLKNIESCFKDSDFPSDMRSSSTVLDAYNDFCGGYNDFCA